METELFEWDGWDQQDTAAFTFYKVILKRKIGSFPEGTKFRCADVDYQRGELVFYGEDMATELAKFKLSLSVSEEQAVWKKHLDRASREC